MAEQAHPFDDAIALQDVGAGRCAARTSAAYANMVGPFGGTIAATLLQSALAHPSRLGDPVALTVNFASAIADGTFEIAAHAVRTNRSTQHWTIVATQAGEVVASASAVFATRRSTWSSPELGMPEAVAPFDAVAPVSIAAGPPWLGRYEMRFLAGAMPTVWDGTEEPQSETRVWVRDNPPRPLDFASLAALCDSFLPRIFLRRRKAVAIGTVTMSAYFHADADMLLAQGDRPLFGLARGVNFRDGYFDQTAGLWDDQRRLLASTHQLVYFRE